MSPPRSLLGASGLLVTAAALIVYFTYPLALQPASLGRVDSGDGQFSIWNVGWVARALTIGSRRLFDANIFHPHRGTLAFSEPNIGAGVLGIPAFLATGSAVAAHNWAVLQAALAAIVGMYLLVRYLTGRRDAAIVSAILYTFCPYWFAHTAHIQLLMTFGIPWVMLAFHRFADAPSTGRAALLGIALGVQALFCGYYGVLAGILVGYAMVFVAIGRGFWRRPAWWMSGGLAAALSVLMVLPFLMPILSLTAGTGFGRQLGDARMYAADWRAYLASAAWLHRWMLPLLGTWREVLFPGFVSLALSVLAIGAVFVVRSAVPLPRQSVREITGLYLGLVLLALWISFGPAAGLYAALYQVVPVFSLLRAPSRFGIAVIFGLAVLAGIGATVLLDRARGSRARLLASALCLAAIVDLSTTMPGRPVGQPARAYTVLATLPYGPVAEFPFFHQSAEFHLHARYMFNSTYHWMPLVNGYSDYIPPDFQEIATPLASFPNLEGFAVLRARRARYAVFHAGRYTYANRLHLRQRLEDHAEHLRPHVVEGDTWLYEIVSWPPEVLQGTVTGPLD